MTDTENPQPEENDVEGHAKASPQAVEVGDDNDVEGHAKASPQAFEVDDEDDVEGHAKASPAPGFVTGALGPDNPTPSAKII